MKEEIKREVPSGHPAEMALKTLTNPEMVASWIPMMSGLEEVEPLELYRAVFADSVGPFRLKADMDIDVAVSDDRIVVSATGKDRQIGSRLEFGGTLWPVAGESTDGQCTIHVEGSYEITGKAAQMGASTIRRKAEKIVASFIQSMERRLAE